MKKLYFYYLFLFILTCLTGCGFHLQGQRQLAKPLQKMYLQTPDPYGQLARFLEQNLKASNIELVSSPEEADTILSIRKDEATQEFLNVSGTQQTRQYSLRVTVVFEITNKNGKILLPAQSLNEARAITVQSNQILASSNQANLFYIQMRRTLAYAIMNRISSKEVTRIVENAFNNPTPKTS